MPSPTCSGVMASLHLGSLLPQSCAFGFTMWITFAGSGQGFHPAFIPRTPPIAVSPLQPHTPPDLRLSAAKSCRKVAG